MAFNPFFNNLAAMQGLMGQSHFPPMAGVMPLGLPPPHVAAQMGVTLPTGVASISAPPVRNIVADSPSLLGPFPGMPHPNGMPGFPHMAMPQPPLLPVKKPQVPSGPVIPVFVGNITERAPDMLIRQLLSKCGSVNQWKRAQGANGKLQQFGFCDFSDPDSAMRAIRILHNYDIADKKLVVKASEKANEQLLEYVKQKNPAATGPDDLVDEATKREDDEIRASISLVLREHELELTRDFDSSKDRKKADKRSVDPSKPNEGIEDIEMEEEKRHLIHREIDKFRDTYKALNVTCNLTGTRCRGH